MVCEQIQRWQEWIENIFRYWAICMKSTGKLHPTELPSNLKTLKLEERWEEELKVKKYLVNKVKKQVDQMGQNIPRLECGLKIEFMLLTWAKMSFLALVLFWFLSQINATPINFHRISDVLNILWWMHKPSHLPDMTQMIPTWHISILPWEPSDSWMTFHCDIFRNSEIKVSDAVFIIHYLFN